MGESVMTSFQPSPDFGGAFPQKMGRRNRGERFRLPSRWRHSGLRRGGGSPAAIREAQPPGSDENYYQLHLAEIT